MLLKLDNVGFKYKFTGQCVLNGVSLHLDKGETVAIFGDSGSGKSTIGKIVSGIIPPTKGNIVFDGQPARMPFKGSARRNIQIIFQHPEVSFNPKLTLLESLKEPYVILNAGFSLSKLRAYLERYGIHPEILKRRPHALSGGELQRLAIARAMIMEPKLVILDEPTAMLDVISQAQIIRLLNDVQKAKGVSYLFISHDIALCEFFCKTIYWLENGVLS
ncbi:MAG: ATP-binding cassette domain-containing protein [Deltaproteobacteria bacterium]|jgi:peptide/nickel transport system ATP-binding protein|nr:ATP-binding cassette domain-containing protein [Deltaproteobacteria bacterium]